MLRIDCISLFPEMLSGFITCSMIGRAVKNGHLTIEAHNLRDWATGARKITDDSPFGGGSGMVMKPEPVFAAIKELATDETEVVYMCPDGEQLSTALAKELAKEQHIVVLSGHYEGIDERIRESVVDREVSVGDYVLTNGTLAAAVLIDAVSRHVPGVLGGEHSLEQDSFSDGLLSYPQYTRPANYQGMEVPAVLLSGNHAEIAKWRSDQRIARTKQRRPDLIKQENI